MELPAKLAPTIENRPNANNWGEYFSDNVWQKRKITQFLLYFVPGGRFSKLLVLGKLNASAAGKYQLAILLKADEIAAKLKNGQAAAKWLFLQYYARQSSKEKILLYKRSCSTK